ncbi:MAG: hypothetical protein HCTKY_2280 [Candidatus Hepatoplasma crinochetorum]|jgi:hypothetical protein|nr:MAG: hypothetical protein HCTKY_2280 [Candidatus Hepatoplasma crinochetorum]
MRISIRSKWKYVNKNFTLLINTINSTLKNDKTQKEVNKKNKINITEISSELLIWIRKLIILMGK